MSDIVCPEEVKQVKRSKLPNHICYMGVLLYLSYLAMKVS